MALYLIKPVLWNTEGYARPSGVRAAKTSYPGEHGYGHEEWNNSSRMAFSEGGQDYRVFHTEGVKNAPVHENEGQVFVFMTASHDGVQQLVGVAGNAMHLVGDDERFEAERKRIAKLLKLSGMWRDVWALPRVRARFGDDQAAFREYFRNECQWIPNWICPADFFMWFDEPVTLAPRQITGSALLPKMFSGYQPLSLDAAVRVLGSVPEGQRSEVWRRLMDAICSAPDSSSTLPSNADAANIPVTTQLTEILARRGQGKFREALMRKWGAACAVTGLMCAELLRASHIKPWTQSTPRERLDAANGLLLAAHLDALFDKGLISFDDDGAMLVSPRLPEAVAVAFALPSKLRNKPDAGLVTYLEYHRKNLFAPG